MRGKGVSEHTALKKTRVGGSVERGWDGSRWRASSVEAVVGGGCGLSGKARSVQIPSQAWVLTSAEKGAPYAPYAP
jgi:hypothetical protein